MSLPLVPFTLATGATLTPTLVNTNLAQAAKDVQDNLDQRYTYSSFRLDFTGLADTDNAEEFKAYIRAPFFWEIVSVEVYAYVATANLAALTLQASGSGLVGWVNVPVTPLGAAVRAVGVANFVAQNAGATEVTFTLAPTTQAAATYTLDACWAVIGVRTDRGNAGATHGGYTHTPIAAHDAVDATVMNAKFTALATAVATDTANDKQQRIEVHSKRDLAAAFANNLRDVRIPSSGRRLHSISVNSIAAATNDLTVDVIDENGATVATGTAAGAGIGVTTRTAVTVGLPDTQTVDAPTTAASDYLLRFSRSGVGVATIQLASVVCHWT